MYKFAKTKFEYQGKSLTHAQINNTLGKPKRCRSLGYHYKRAKVLYQGVEICLFFSRRGKRDKWKVLLTTDTTLTFKKLIEHYQVRRLWGLFIELVCTVCEVLEMDADDVLEKMLTNSKAEAMFMTLCASVAKEE